MDDFDSALKFGNLALQFFDRNKNTKMAWLTKVHSKTYGTIFPWKQPIRSTFFSLLQAHAVGHQTGDFEFSKLSAQMHSFSCLVAGSPLSKLEEDLKHFVDLMRACKQSTWLVVASLELQFVQNLTAKWGHSVVITSDIPELDDVLQA